MKFDDLQNSWKAQPIRVEIDNQKLKLQTTTWEKNQQKILRMNVCMSLSFAGTMVGIGWVYLSFHEQYGLPFKISIGGIYLLMVIFSIISWKSYQFKNGKMDLSSQEFIQKQIGKLNWQEHVIKTYTWIYIILLWLIMMLYIWEITKHGTFALKIGAFGITTVYIFGISLWTRFKKQKKQLDKITLLRNELMDLKNGFSD